MSGIDDETRHLVRIAAAIAGAGERRTKAILREATGNVSPRAVDEVILQSYLFAGFPRTLNAARAWRSVSGEKAPPTDPLADLRNGAAWVKQGEETCSIVYGESYDLLRANVRELHPALDSWMIADGYGKVLSRPGLDLKTRELCVVAACAAAGQQRQLHSHLHGALNSGASSAEVTSTFEALSDLVDRENIARYRGLLVHVLNRRHPPPKKGSSDVR